MGKCSCVAPYRKNGNNTYGLNCGLGELLLVPQGQHIGNNSWEDRMGFPQTPFPETARAGSATRLQEAA